MCDNPPNKQFAPQNQRLENKTSFLGQKASKGLKSAANLGSFREFLQYLMYDTD